MSADWNSFLKDRILSRLSGRYESYAGLSAAEDCGILHGCENGRCIRVAEGYTCDCYQGYELDMTSMTCTGTQNIQLMRFFLLFLLSLIKF